MLMKLTLAYWKRVSNPRPPDCGIIGTVTCLHLFEIGNVLLDFRFDPRDEQQLFFVAI